MIKHRHHIVPKHMGGNDDPSNLIEITIEEHAEAHRLLWVEHGLLEDYLAWKGLLGLMSKEEILTEIFKENGRRMGKLNKGKQAPNKGVPMSEEQKRKLKKPKTEEHKQNLRKPKSNTENMGKYKRTEKTKRKLRENRIKLAKDPAFIKKLSDSLKKSRATCIYCGMESNKSNITRHQKSCKKKINPE